MSENDKFTSKFKVKVSQKVQSLLKSLWNRPTLRVDFSVQKSFLAYPPIPCTSSMDSLPRKKRWLLKKLSFSGTKGRGKRGQLYSNGRQLKTRRIREKSFDTKVSNCLFYHIPEFGMFSRFRSPVIAKKLIWANWQLRHCFWEFPIETHTLHQFSTWPIRKSKN